MEGLQVYRMQFTKKRKREKGYDYGIGEIQNTTNWWYVVHVEFLLHVEYVYAHILLSTVQLYHLKETFILYSSKLD